MEIVLVSLSHIVYWKVGEITVFSIEMGKLCSLSVQLSV